MSSLGITPGEQGDNPGAVHGWAVKRKLNQRKITQEKRKEKFSNLVKQKERNCEEKSSKDLGEKRQERKQNKNKNRRLDTKGRPGMKHKPKYTMTYSATVPAGHKTKKRRETQGTIPNNTVKDGKSSTLYGHTVVNIDNRSTFRALFQNPNGINPHPGNYELALSLTECYDNCIALIGLAETNRAWEKPEQQKQLREAIHKNWTSSVVQTSTSTEEFEDNYKPGGTLTMVCEDHWTCRVREKGEDPWGLGRWSNTLLAGKGNKKVMSINGYIVCQSSPSSAGVTTAYKQQYNILRDRLTGKIDPRKQGIMDMQTWIAFLIASGIEIILYLDANEDITNKIGKWCEPSPYEPQKHSVSSDHDGSLATLVTTLGLIDVLKSQHDGIIPPTYIRGKRRLDYVFVTPGIIESVERSSLLPFHTGLGGNHRPVLIDFD
jgi:hypothetical protein